MGNLGLDQGLHPNLIPCIPQMEFVPFLAWGVGHHVAVGHFICLLWENQDLSILAWGNDLFVSCSNSCSLQKHMYPTGVQTGQ